MIYCTSISYECGYVGAAEEVRTNKREHSSCTHVLSCCANTAVGDYTLSTCFMVDTCAGTPTPTVSAANPCNRYTNTHTHTRQSHWLANGVVFVVQPDM